MAVGPIPFTAIVEYSKIFDVGEFSEFLFLIRVMDNKFLNLETKRIKVSAQKPSEKK